MNSQVVGRKEASAGGLIRPLVTYALLSFLPPAKETTSNLKERDARAQASDPASAAPSDLPPGRAQAVWPGAACDVPVRHQSIWDRIATELKECLAHLWVQAAIAK